MNRIKREEASYDEGLDRDLWNKIGKQGFFENKRRAKIFENFLNTKKMKILEIGCSKWADAVLNNSDIEHDITCINISQREIDEAKEEFKDIKPQPKYIKMDAHKLNFSDKQFDFIFGYGMLHHLDYVIALKEINRCLKDEGLAVFKEPLDINPASKLVRILTPKSRTIDEKPFVYKDLIKIRKTMNVSYENYDQFFTFIFALISSFFSEKADNIFIKFGLILDDNIKKIFPFSKYFFRSLTIVFKKT